MGNGGITDPQQAKEILEKYPLLDGLGIARGTLGRPWIFEEIKKTIQCPPPLPEGRCPEGTEGWEMRWEQIKKIMLAHAKLLYKTKNKKGLLEIRKHLAWYVKGLPNASELRQKLVQVQSMEEIKNILK